MIESRYVFLEHTADAKFQAFGDTLEEAFANSALAMVSLMWEPGSLQITERKNIHIEGKDLEQLLMGFLEEVLFLLDTKDFLLSDIVNVKIQKRAGKFRLTAEFRGEKIRPDHEIFGEVKAVTYDEMKIVQGDVCKIQVVVDL